MNRQGNWFRSTSGLVPDMLRRRPRTLTPPSTPWSPSERGPTRVLLECAPESSPAIVATILERAGFEVATCVGPAEHERCPVACDAHCSALHKVDVVVNMLGTKTPERREVLGAVASTGPRRPPIIAMVDDPDDAPVGVRTINLHASASELVQAVRDAAEAGSRPGAIWGDGV